MEQSIRMSKPLYKDTHWISVEAFCTHWNSRRDHPTPSDDGTPHSEATAATQRLNGQTSDFSDPKEASGCEHEWRTDTFFSGFKRRQVKKSCVKCGEVVIS